jgi:hypothetical protein
MWRGPSLHVGPAHAPHCHPHTGCASPTHPARPPGAAAACQPAEPAPAPALTLTLSPPVQEAGVVPPGQRRRVCAAGVAVHGGAARSGTGRAAWPLAGRRATAPAAQALGCAPPPARCLRRPRRLSRTLHAHTRHLLYCPAGVRYIINMGRASTAVFPRQRGRAAAAGRGGAAERTVLAFRPINELLQNAYQVGGVRVPPPPSTLAPAAAPPAGNSFRVPQMTGCRLLAAASGLPLPLARLPVP